MLILLIIMLILIIMYIIMSITYNDRKINIIVYTIDTVIGSETFASFIEMLLLMHYVSL